jgi:hypothetical protein
MGTAAQALSKWAAVVAAQVMLLAPRAHAEAPKTPGPERLDSSGAPGYQAPRYLAPPACPGAAWFEAELAARLGLRGSEIPARVALTVEIQAVEAGYLGRARWLDPEGSEIVREVSHQSCEQVARALALIGAVMAETSAAPRADGPLARATGPAGAASVPPSVPSAVPPPAGAPESRPLVVYAPWRWRTGPSMTLGLASSVMPIVAAGPRGGWEIVAEEPFGHGGYAAGLSLGYLRTGTRDYDGYQASFTWIALRIEACPFWRPVRRLDLAWCIFADVGELRGQGIGKPNYLDRGSLWTSPGLAGRADWRIFGPLAVRIEGGPFFPLWPPTFYFPLPDNGKQEIYRVPNAGLTVEAGLAAHLP